jgi:hypothetical protein
MSADGQRRLIHLRRPHHGPLTSPPARRRSLTLTKRARASLRKGQTVTVVVTVRHPEGFTTEGRASGKVQ